MMSRRNQEYVEELLNYGFSPKVIHARKTKQKEIQDKEVGK